MLTAQSQGLLQYPLNIIDEKGPADHSLRQQFVRLTLLNVGRDVDMRPCLESKVRYINLKGTAFLRSLSGIANHYAYCSLRQVQYVVPK